MPDPISDLFEGLSETLGFHPAPTPFLRWNGDVLEQKWTGHDGEAWVPVPGFSASKEPAKPKAPVIPTPDP